MTNTDRILSLSATLTKDVHTTSDELKELITLVSDEIMVETRVIKKLYQLAVFDKQQFYDLKSNAQLQDGIEEQVTGRVLTGLNLGNNDVEENKKSILNLMSGKQEFIKPEITFEVEALYADESSSTRYKRNEFIAIDDIFNGNMQSVMDKFEIINGHRYKVLDLNFLRENDDVTLFYIASVVSDLNNVDKQVFASLAPVIIQGVKFYLYNDPVSKDSDQANNLQAMRYFKAKQNLIDQYPQKITMKRRTNRWL